MSLSHARAFLSLVLQISNDLIIITLISISLYYLFHYFKNKHGLNRYPGPFIARFSRIWLGYHSRFGKRYQIIHQLHQKYGAFVRIAPNELSIADPDAIPIILGHGTGTTKSKFYDAFVANRRGLFSTRDRKEHTRKRKIISSTFSHRNIMEFEPYILETLRVLTKRMDQVISENCSQEGWSNMDFLPWCNYIAFDVIGDLAFGERFGMLETGADVAAVERDGEIFYSPAIQILNERSDFSAAQGCLPVGLRPYMKYIDPWFSRGADSVKNLTGIAVNRVKVRLSQPDQSRKDLLARLQTGRDADGNPMGVEELIAECLTQLIAGSDTVSNSLCAIVWWIAKHPTVKKKLVEELDEHIDSEDTATSYHTAKDLPYLHACINETLRIHSTSSIGLPRFLSESIHFKGHLLKSGLVCSVPSFDIHRNPEVWDNCELFQPERWLQPDVQKYDRAFMPFSVGPRSCIGRNLAMMELSMIISTIFKRYVVELTDPNQVELETREGFLRKPLNCWIKIKLRSG